MPLTGRRGKRFWLSTRSHPQGELPRRARQGASEVLIACLVHGRQRRGEEASEARPSFRERELGEKSEVDGPKLGRVVKRDFTRGRIARVKPCGSAPPRAADESRATHEAVGAARKWARSGVERFVGYSIIGSGRLQKLDTGIFLEASR